MAKSSAPGKIFLFGEHAVVYGEPAVLCAVDRRVTVSAEKTDGERDVVKAPDLTFSGVTASFRTSDTREVRIETDEVGESLAYVLEAIELARSEISSNEAVEVTINSDLPVGAGLGSSAAVVVATLHAVSNELGDGIGKRRIAELGHEVELEVQGSASPSDTFASTMGGMVYVEPSSELQCLETPDYGFVVGYDGGSAPTGEMVAGVRELRESSKTAAEITRLIGDITRDGVEAAESGSLTEVGELMDLNHGLLESLGVSGSTLSEMVWNGRDAGAYGAKLTGAGGRGCVVALVDDDTEAEVKAVIGADAEESFGVKVAEGVRSEKR